MVHRELRKERLHVREHRADQTQPLAGMLKFGEGLQQVRDALAQAHLPDKQDFKALGIWFTHGMKRIQPDSIGNDAHFFRRNPLFHKAARRKAGWDRNAVGLCVLHLFAFRIAWIVDVQRNTPAIMLLLQQSPLIACMCRATIANVFAAA